MQLSLSEGALDRYRRAYALELKISSSEPPNHPAEIGGSEGSGAGENSSVIKKKDGLVAVERRVCRSVSFKNRKPSPKCCHLAFAGQSEPRLCSMTAKLG